MAGRLAGKRALITAAAQGIGRATAIAMAREDALVLATDVNTTLLVALEAEASMTTDRLDVTDGSAIPGLPRRTGPSTSWSTLPGSFITDRFWSAKKRITTCR
jgi:2-keto-3-deoxy-L-fuconate dehydrogenase